MRGREKRVHVDRQIAEFIDNRGLKKLLVENVIHLFQHRNFRNRRANSSEGAQGWRMFGVGGFLGSAALNDGFNFEKQVVFRFEIFGDKIVRAGRKSPKSVFFLASGR